MRFAILIVGLAAAMAPAAALAQAKPVANDSPITAGRSVMFGPIGQPATPVDPTHPLPVSCSGCATSTSDATAANQTTQIAAEQATRDRLGDPSAPAAGTVNAQLLTAVARLSSILSALGSPMQAGGIIGNTSFAITTSAATSVAQEGSVTATAATPTSGTATSASGTAIIGPLVPQLGRDIRVVLKGTWAGSIAIGTSSAVNACAAGTINPLTIGGQAWGVYTANANESVDTPTLAGVVYCATATITSGTLTYAVRQ